MTATFLRVRNLVKHFAQGGRFSLQSEPAVLKAVDSVSFDLAQGTTLGLVGESGCGKSTTARLIMRLIDATYGEVTLQGVNVLQASRDELLKLRRQMQLVFQDPLSSLNPRMTAGTNISEPLRFHRLCAAKERKRRGQEMLETVGLKRQDYDRYPHEFSGGQCQRIAIARALILCPKLVIFDEPVSALDVSIQAQILKLLLELQQEFQLTYIFISHDLSVVKRVCNEIAVMYLGEIVEKANSEKLYHNPQHPYTRALLNSIPSPNPGAARLDDFPDLEGDVPSPLNPPSGCRFHTRCPHRMAICSEQKPALIEIEPGHSAACFLCHAETTQPG